MSTSDRDPPPDDGRRKVLKVLTGGLTACVGAALTVPAVGILGSPLARPTIYGGDEPIAVADLAKLPEGVPVAVKVVAPARIDAWVKFTDVPLGAAWLVRRGDAVEVFSSTCPHAGCFVDWEDKKQQFNCP